MTAKKDVFKVFVVDDHTVVRQGTRDMLVKHPEFDVIGEASCGDNLGGRLKLDVPDLLLLDINLVGDENGLNILKEIKPEFPDMRIVMFSAHTDAQYIRQAVKLNADGYLSKTVTEKELHDKLLKAIKDPGEPVYSSDILEKLDRLAEDDKASSLTAREEEILILVARGMTNRDISKELVVSVKTVDIHVANLIKKIAVNNRAQLTAYAYENGFL